MVVTFFYDTYALLEVAYGNPNFTKKAEGTGMIITRLNLMELHFILLRTKGEILAKNAFETYKPFARAINDDIILEANHMKLKFNKRKLSYVDCIGYCLARKRGVKFLTGDRGFEDLENVEFLR
jgi:hypothetical protein